MELSWNENFALLILMIKEGGEDGKKAEEKLLSLAKALDCIAKEVEARENAK